MKEVIISGIASVAILYGIICTLAALFHFVGYNSKVKVLDFFIDYHPEWDEGHAVNRHDR